MPSRTRRVEVIKSAADAPLPLRRDAAPVGTGPSCQKDQDALAAGAPMRKLRSAM
ncbi:hypothetical protein AB0N62_39760 [Streptomyces sp. NPDC093982]|uniref:hypothetical protein n=1 Tax=Streptomyces sp. NPDC093982 TaxID=3155077 RepID=UPI0034209113